MNRFVVFGLAIFVSTASARSLGPASIDDLFQFSTFVGFVKIERVESLAVENEECGFRYIASVDRVLKGVAPIGRVSFGRYKGLAEKGKRYLVFLSWVRNAHDYYTNNIGLVSSEFTPEIQTLIECHGLVPGLMGASALFTSGDVILVPRRAVLLPESEWPNQPTVVNKEMVAAYLLNLKGNSADKP